MNSGSCLGEALLKAITLPNDIVDSNTQLEFIIQDKPLPFLDNDLFTANSVHDALWTDVSAADTAIQHRGVWRATLIGASVPEPNAAILGSSPAEGQISLLPVIFFRARMKRKIERPGFRIRAQ